MMNRSARRAIEARPRIIETAIGSQVVQLTKADLIVQTEKQAA